MTPPPIHPLPLSARIILGILDRMFRRAWATHCTEAALHYDAARAVLEETMSRPTWVYPCDPQCPEVERFYSTLDEDPMTEAMGAPMDDIIRGWESRHLAGCRRCQQYGAENVEVG